MVIDSGRLRKLSLRTPLGALLAACLATILFLPDVVFMGRSLLASDYQSILTDRERPKEPYNWTTGGASPRMNYRRNDPGATTWQFEPGVQFMTRVFWAAESPYWNPYTATGSLGPETLGDMKFSVLTLGTAILGGTPAAYHFVFLLLVTLASYALIRICTAYFNLGTLATIGALTAQLLGGWVQLNLYAPFLIFVYFLAPITLLACLSLATQPSALRLLATVTAFVALFSTSFLPVVILATIFVYVVTLSFTLETCKGRLYATLLLLLVAPIAAFLLLAPLYLPTIAGLEYTSLLTRYLYRKPESIPLEHFSTVLIAGTSSVIPNVGVVGLVLAPIGVFSGSRRLRWLRLALFATFLTGLLAVFAVFPFDLIRSLPVLRSIGVNYWTYLYCAPIPFLVGFALEAVHQRNWHWITLLLSISIVGFALWYGITLGLDFEYNGVSAFYLCTFLAILSLVAVAVGEIPAVTAASGFVLLGLLLFEGAFFTNFTRPIRYDKVADPPPILAWLRDDLGGPSEGRVLNIGRGSLFPEWADAFRISEIGTMNTSQLKWYKQFYTQYIGNEYKDKFLSIGLKPDYRPYFSDETLDLLGINYIVVDKRNIAGEQYVKDLGYPVLKEDRIRSIFSNPDALDRAFVVGAVVEGEGLPADLGLKNSEAAVTPDARLLGAARDIGVPAVSSSPPGSVRIKAYHHGWLELEAQLERPGVLVVMDAWHPQWSATVDGKEAYVGRVNQAFRGIALPPGRHVIVMKYRPQFFWLAVSISVLTGLALLAACAQSFWRRNRAHGPTPISPIPAACQPSAEPNA